MAYLNSKHVLLFNAVFSSGHGLEDGFRIIPFRYKCTSPSCDLQPLSTADDVLSQLTTAERALYPFVFTARSCVSTTFRDVAMNLMLTTPKRSGFMNMVMLLRTSFHTHTRLCYLEACQSYGKFLSYGANPF